MSKTKEISKPQGNSRFLRGGFYLLIFILGLLIFGSILIRAKVSKTLRNRKNQSTSVVNFAPFQIKQNSSILDTKLLERLKRLGYKRQKNSQLTRSGFFYYEPGARLNIYLRGRWSPKIKKKLDTERIYIDLDKNNRVIGLEPSPRDNTNSLVSIKNRAYLEPEIIATLSDSSSRDVDYKHFDEFPEVLLNAVLAIEDERFYSHSGVDIKAIFRATIVNIKSGKIVQGGSTITQQLAKNLLLTSKRSLSRKILEACYAILLETAYSKDKILEFYLNEIFLTQIGNRAIHGFSAAANSFYGKNLNQLTLAETATLAGLIKGPSSYSPRRYPKKALIRRKLVLDKMLELELITEEKANLAKAEEISIKPAKSKKRLASYYIDYLKRESKLGSINGPVQVFSGIDSQYQICAQESLQSQLKEIESNSDKLIKNKEKLQAGLISISPQSGFVRAWVGGRDYGKNQFDRVSQARRQPGSVFKPFVYLTAVDKNLNNYKVARTTTLLRDEPIEVHQKGQKPWRPKNYSETFKGDVTLRESLTYSLNIPTVELAQKVGIENVARTARLFGLGENLPEVPSIALGAGDLSLLEVVRAYSAIANGGELVNILPFVSAQKDSNKKGVMSNNDEIVPQTQFTRVSSPQATYILTNILQSVIENGTGRGVRTRGFKTPVAGKTGTSNDTRDSWFVGFTPSLLTVVWVGYDNNESTGLTGASGALPIWTEYNKCVQKMEPELNFIPPDGVVHKKIDSSTGLLPTAFCPKELITTEVFIDEFSPTSYCYLHKQDENSDFFRNNRLKSQRNGRVINNQNEQIRNRRNSNPQNKRKVKKENPGIIDFLFGGA